MWSPRHVNPLVQVQKPGKYIECACGFIGEESNHSLHSHTILSIFPIFKSIAKYVPRTELENLRDAFPKDVAIERAIHKFYANPSIIAPVGIERSSRYYKY